MLQTKKIVFSAMAIALAIVIATVIKLPSLPFGGSATLFSMLVVCLVGYWYGPKYGLFASITYGILQFITGPYIVHPLQIILDFPLAFGALGLSGFFYQKKHGLLVGYLAGVAGRFLFSTISGFIFYTEYVPDINETLLNMWVSFTYNLSYLAPEAIVTAILLALPPIRKVMKQLKGFATA